MIKSSLKLSINNIRYYSSAALSTNGFGGIQSILGQNQAVQFSTPISKGNTVIFKHPVEQIPFQPKKIHKKTLEHNFKENEINQMKKLRVEGKSLEKIAEQYKTQSKVVSVLTKSDPAVRQIQIENHRIKGPKSQESAEIKKARLEEWTKKNQQREYDLKVIKAAESHERIIRQRRDINEMNTIGHQESFDMILKNQTRDALKNQQKFLTPDEKKSRAKMLSNLRRRKVVDDVSKKQEMAQRAKNKTAKKTRE
ncbi:hypothetical protein DICPUDRAFT_45970 [Dictyostelium purpureum]|uniref:Uncharacterized protein n=1 Tax=Dictyostelium purpureum TaxID=5786 RepID=F0ZCT0_DICPU|nr:uncharacterized protein DICPUDRAFT_45970 [Dictyostelium purpureum]EGC38272.1 hypothetical protein DICPUDRAFT_45970 [Dictyostelium purpureum]|eukprot:XP_003285229.1 hypothetical protein DICPUDRAFT_45970 [Dictyostelium purpureum]